MPNLCPTLAIANKFVTVVITVVALAHGAAAQVLEPAPSEPQPPSAGAPLASSAAGVAKPWQLQTIAMAEPPEHIFASGSLQRLGSVRIAGRSGAWFFLKDCGEGICAVQQTIAHVAETLPAGAVPMSHVAVAHGRIARAWFGAPTQRLDGSPLGPVTAGSLVVEDATSSRYQLELGLNQVFEDTTPRLVEMGADRQQLIITVLTTVGQGSVLVAARLDGEGLLRIVAQTQPAGDAGTWLDPVAIADVTGQGRPSIAVVRDPGSRGVLEIYDFDGRDFQKHWSVPGVSNHAPGGSVQNLGLAAIFDSSGIATLAVPNTSRTIIRILSFANSQVSEPADIALPAPVTTEIAAIATSSGQRPMLLMGLEDGELVLLR